MPDQNELLGQLKRGLIVSCQAAEGEPLCAPQHIVALSLSALNGGAAGLRLEGIENIKAVRQRTTAPIVGLTKSASVADSERLKSVYITSTLNEGLQLVDAGADFVALDATSRPRPDGLSIGEVIGRLHQDRNTLVWADVATIEEGVAAAGLGADVISTTLSGYTEQTAAPLDNGPDLSLLESLCKEVSLPVVLEGRVWHPHEVKRAFELGAFAVVVGSAITRPQLVTQRFVRAIP